MKVLVACKRGNIAERDKWGHCLCADCKAYNNGVRKKNPNRPAYILEWKKNNPDKLKTYQMNHRGKNRDKINARGRIRNKRDDVREHRNRDRRQWAAREKQKAVDYRGGKCEICGYNKCLAAMDFHHKNPLEKNGYGTGALKSHWTFEKNKPEIDKCILVCVRCHREIHAGVIIL